MKKLLGIIVLSLLFSGCDNVGSSGQCIKGDCFFGQGTFVTNEYTYVGVFKNSYRHGQGTLTLASDTNM